MHQTRAKITVVLLVSIFFLVGCSSLLFYPLKGLIDNPLVAPFNPAGIYFKTSDGLTLHGWFLKGEEPQRGTVLFLHGNAENLSTHVNNVLWLVREGFNIFIFDYRGYGLSEGSPTLEGVHRDAEAALETLLTLPEVDKNRVAVLGQSIGGAIAIYTVAVSPYKETVKALVVDSVFSSYRLIAREKLGQVFITWPFQYPLSYLFSDYYSPIRWIPQISPILLLILHGPQDPVVPAHHSRILYEVASDPKALWSSHMPGHISSLREEQVRKDLVAYLLDAFQRPDSLSPVQK